MSDVLREHLQATIKHLSVRRNVLEIEIQEIEEVLKTLRREEESLIQTRRIVFPALQREGVYAGISIRWAVLLFLSENSASAQPLSSIVDSLIAGGSTTKAQSFSSNVSAVLSQMAAKGEVKKVDEGFFFNRSGIERVRRDTEKRKVYEPQPIGGK